MARPRVASDAEIVAAAARIVARDGPYGATLAEVGAEVGITAAAVAQRFGSKRALFLAVARSGVGLSRDAFAAARAAHPRPLDVLMEALASFAGGVSTAREIANGLALLQIDATDPEFRDIARTLFDGLRTETHALLDEAVKKRHLRHVDTATLALSVEDAYHGALIVWAVRQENLPADAVREALLRVLAPHVRRLPAR